MFAVPGWSLGELKSQKEEPKPRKATSGSSKKRKRKAAQEAAQESDPAISQAAPPGTTSENHNEQVEKRRRLAPSGESEHTSGVSNAQTSQAPRNVEKSAAPSKAAGKPEKRRGEYHEAAVNGSDSIKATTDAMPPAPPSNVKLTPLQTAMRQKLAGARFRHLNETLYTSPSEKALALFEANPTFFEEYHHGFRQQVSSWPENPVQSFVHDLRQRGGTRHAGPEASGPRIQHLPRSNGTCYVADLGCGDAALAQQLAPEARKLSIRVSNFDLHGDNSLVTKADISNLPLKDGSTNVAIFCLALMGTNWIDFIEEAWRILHWKGELWVAEIKSRFAAPRQRQVEHSVGKRRKKPAKEQASFHANDEETLRSQVDGVEGQDNRTDVSAFVQVLSRRGFALDTETGIDLRNKMFVKMRFIKSVVPMAGKHAGQGAGQGPKPPMRRMAPATEDVDVKAESEVLKPCLYKVR